MVFIKILYFFNKALDNIRQSPFVNLVAIGVIAISFLIFSTFLMLFGNLNSLLALWEEEIQIEIFLDDNMSGEKIDALQKKVVSMANVKEIRYISKEEALSSFKKSIPGMDVLVKDLKDNPLPASFEIKLEENSISFDMVKAAAKKLSTIDGVSDAVYGQEWVERFSTSLAIARLVGLIIGAFLLMATIFIVSNTIKLTVYTRKEELEITRLLGATDRFIRLPFFIEGILQGLAGSALSLAGLYLAYRVFIVKLTSSVQASLITGTFQLSFLSTPTITYVLFGGMALGLFGSFISLGRFLKV